RQRGHGYPADPPDGDCRRHAQRESVLRAARRDVARIAAAQAAASRIGMAWIVVDCNIPNIIADPDSMQHQLVAAGFRLRRFFRRLKPAATKKSSINSRAT